mgnify:CR=1 FL=1
MPPRVTVALLWCRALIVNAFDYPLIVPLSRWISRSA